MIRPKTALIAALALAPLAAASETRMLESAGGDAVSVEMPRRSGSEAEVSLCLSVPQLASGPKGFDLGGGSTVTQVAPGMTSCRPVAPARHVLRLWDEGGPAIRSGLDLSGRGGGRVGMSWVRD